MDQSPASLAAAALDAPLLDVRGVTLQYRTPDSIVTAHAPRQLRRAAGGPLRAAGTVRGAASPRCSRRVAGYLDPVEGEFHLRGRRIRKPGPDRMMVFQEFDQLLPWKSVRDNIMFPLLATQAPGQGARPASAPTTTSTRSA